MYADSPAGLEQFVEDLLTAIRDKDNAKVDSLWQSTILPSHPVWFATVFGEKEGISLEANYAKHLANSPYTPGKVTHLPPASAKSRFSSCHWQRRPSRAPTLGRRLSSYL